MLPLLSATANPASATRTANVTVSGAGVAPVTVIVVQDAPYLNVSPTSLDIPPIANKNTVTVSSNINWAASSNQTWLTVVPARGLNNATVTLSATANPTIEPRTATVTFSGLGVIPVTVTVTQDAGP